MSLSASADAWAAPSLSDLEQKHGRLVTYQGRLETQLAEQVKRIGRLKGQPVGVRRDYQLSAALRQNQQLAGRLSTIQRQMRQVQGQLGTAYDRAMAASEDQKLRRELRRKKRALRPLPTQASPRIITDESASALDSPEDLEEKADLLDDSREKVRRQLLRVRRRATHLQRRVKLSRHSRSLEDSPFDETSVGRIARGDSGTASAKIDSDRAAGPSAAAPGETGYSGGAGTSSANKNGVGTAAPPASTGDGTLNGFATTGDDQSVKNGGGYTGTLADPGAGASGNAAGLSSLTIQEAMDPALLRSLSHGRGSNGSLSGRIKALERADKQLSQMLRQLSNKSNKLRSRAEKLKKIK